MSATVDGGNGSGGFAGKFADALSGLFEMVIKSRRQHYGEHPDRKPRKSDIPRLISDASKLNAAISGGAGLVPGPFGMLALLPEIIAVTRNQLVLVYDIAVANGKDTYITPQSFVGIFVAAFGMSATSLGAIQGGKFVVKRTSLRAMQKIISLLGGKITQQALKAALGKWVPLLGAAALAAWSHNTTKSIGNRASKILVLDIEMEE
jgi:hypothetical protein